MPNPRSLEAWAAEIFRVDVSHILEAPKYCGDGIDGTCLAGECEVVAAVGILRAYAAQARQEEREVTKVILEDLKNVFAVSSEERFNELRKFEAESTKWKAEGDMYGWNFHQGMAAGANLVDIIYQRVNRAIAAALRGREA